MLPAEGCTLFTVWVDPTPKSIKAENITGASKYINRNSVDFKNLAEILMQVEFVSDLSK